MKKIITFSYTDGKPVTKTDKGFSLKAPLQLTMNAKTDGLLDLGLSCDRPLLISLPLWLRKLGIEMLGPSVVEPGERVVIRLRNASDSQVLIEEGDRLATAFPLVVDELDIG